MNLKEQLEAKKEELKSLDLTTEEGIKSGEALTEEITKLDSLVKKAEEVAKVKESIGQVEKKEEEEMDGIKSANLEELKTQKGSKSFAFKAYNDPETAPSVGVTSQKVVDAQPALGVRDLFGAEAISGNALTYYTLGSMAGSFGTVAQGGSKPQVNVAYDDVTVALSKIAGFLKETDELLTDAAFLESAIRGRGVYEFKKAVDAFLVDSLLAVDGIQQGANSISFDNILKAKQAVRTSTGYAADALLINPADLETLLLTKDSNLQYLLGGPAYGSYGNGAYASNPRIWGLTVVESEAIEQGAAIVGAFKAGSSVVTKAGEGLRVEVSNSDQDDFIKNMVTVRIEERLALATRVPAAFALVGTVSSSS